MLLFNFICDVFVRLHELWYKVRAKLFSAYPFCHILLL